MSFYNMICGFNPASLFLYPVLFENHPDNFPRFRDCFYNDKTNLIEVYSRMGGGNRDCWEDNRKEDCDCPACLSDDIENNDNCVSRIDDDFDNTYCTFSFKIPEKYKNDVNLILQDKIKETSDDYKNLIIKIFPKIEKGLKELLYNKEKK